MINAYVGEPSVISQIWKQLFIQQPLQIPHNCSYSAMDDRGLKNSILNLHRTIHKLDTTDLEVVITNGASQALSALSYNYNIVNNTPEAIWFRLLELRNIHPNSQQIMNFRITPDNPTGKIYPFASDTIFDCVYLWPSMFYKTPMPLPTEFKGLIFGLSKLTGQASYRLGWFLTKDKDLAQEMREYVEITTAGVSLPTQRAATDSISVLINNPDFRGTFFNNVSRKLASRSNQLSSILKRHGITSLQEVGMFAWVTAEFDVVSKLCGLGVNPGPGSAFNTTDQYARINLALNEENWNKLIACLK